MIVVVGAGLAGLQTVVALRGQGYAGALTLLGAEAEPPYDRPPLSKELLRGEVESTTFEADWAALDVDLRLGVRATAVGDRQLATDAGEVAFEKCVLATGAEPRRLPGTATTLRTRSDALALRAALRPGSRLAIVGAGWIGAEVATAAVAAGVHVTVLEGLGAPLATALPARGRVADAAVVGGRRTSGSARPSRRSSPASCTWMAATRLLPMWCSLAIGARPVVPAGPALDRGRRGRRRPAAADVVTRRVGTRRLRVLGVGAVRHPDAGRALGRRAAGARGRGGQRAGGAQVWDPVPYFWSEQWGRMVQYAGHHPAGERVVWREEGERWAAFWLAGDRLVAALTVDRPRDLVQARHLMERDAAVDPALLADPAVAVKAAAV